MSDVTISISGGDEDERGAIAKIVERTLEDHGFTVRNDRSGELFPLGVLRRMALGTGVFIEDQGEGR